MTGWLTVGLALYVALLVSLLALLRSHSAREERQGGLPEEPDEAGPRARRESEALWDDFERTA